MDNVDPLYLVVTEQRTSDASCIRRIKLARLLELLKQVEEDITDAGDIQAYIDREEKLHGILELLSYDTIPPESSLPMSFTIVIVDMLTQVLILFVRTCPSVW